MFYCIINTMEHVLTAKIPVATLKSLHALAEARGVSKGTLVRQALALLFVHLADPLSHITHITAAMREGRRLHGTVNWKAIYHRTRAGAATLSPEDEVRRNRQRVP